MARCAVVWNVLLLGVGLLGCSAPHVVGSECVGSTEKVMKVGKLIISDSHGRERIVIGECGSDSRFPGVQGRPDSIGDSAGIVVNNVTGSPVGYLLSNGEGAWFGLVSACDGRESWITAHARGDGSVILRLAGLGGAVMSLSVVSTPSGDGLHIELVDGKRKNRTWISDQAMLIWREGKLVWSDARERLGQEAEENDE